MKEKSELFQNNRSGFFRRNRSDKDFDECTFDMWKCELQKGLPVFWEEMSGFRK